MLNGPLSVAGIAREMGMARQSVQRIADLLVDRGLAQYRPNLAHRRAKLVAPTALGRSAVHAIDPAHAEVAARLSSAMGQEEMASALAARRRVCEVLDQLDAEAATSAAQVV